MDKLVVAQLVKKYPTVYWTRNFISKLARARMLSKAKRLQPIY